MNILGEGKRNRGMIKSELLWQAIQSRDIGSCAIEGLHIINVFKYVLHQILIVTATTMLCCIEVFHHTNIFARIFVH